MELRPFRPEHAALVAGWAETAEDLDRWASLDEPATAQTFAAWLDDPEVSAWMLIDDRPVAYGELWVSHADDEVELGRLLVAPADRGRGVGRAFVTLLVAQAGQLGVSQAWVRVVRDNAPALRCYESAGFARTPPEHEAQLNAPQPRSYRWLRRAL